MTIKRALTIAITILALGATGLLGYQIAQAQIPSDPLIPPEVSYGPPSMDFPVVVTPNEGFSGLSASIRIPGAIIDCLPTPEFQGAIKCAPLDAVQMTTTAGAVDLLRQVEPGGDPVHVMTLRFTCPPGSTLVDVETTRLDNEEGNPVALPDPIQHGCVNGQPEEGE